MQIRCDQIVSELQHLFPDTGGDLEVMVSRAVPPVRAGAGCLVFASNETALLTALAAGAAVIMLPLKLKARIPAGAKAAFLFTPDLKLAMALVLQRHFDGSRARFRQDPPIEPRAFVSTEARVGKGAVISAGAFAGARAASVP